MAGLAKLRHVERYPWHAVSTAVSDLFVSFARPAYLYSEECVYIRVYTYLTAQGLYMNCRPATTNVSKTRSCNYSSETPDDGR
jgi:hypothetical protein